MQINHNYGDNYVSTWELLIRRMKIFDGLSKPVREKLSHCLMPFEPTDIAIEARKPGSTVEYLVSGLQKADERYHTNHVLQGKAPALPRGPSGLKFELTPNPNRTPSIWERRAARRGDAVAKRTKRSQNTPSPIAALPALPDPPSADIPQSR